MSGPVSPADYGEGSTDEQLEAGGYAAGLAVWGQVGKAYGNYLGDGTLANSQLWSLREAIRAQAYAEIRQLATDVGAFYDAPCPSGVVGCIHQDTPFADLIGGGGDGDGA